MPRGNILKSESLNKAAFIKTAERGGILKRAWRALLRKPPGTRDLMNFCHQFASLLSSGIPVLTSMEILAKQLEPPALKDGIRAAIYRVEEGDSLAEALSTRKDIYSPFFIGMIKAAEASGTLDQALFRLAHHFKNKDLLEQKIKAATNYPKLVFFLVLVVVVLLIAFVIPNFERTFINMGVEPPLITKILLSIGTWIRLYWQQLIAGVLVSALALLKISKIDKFAYYRDLILMRLPLFGQLNRKIAIAQYCRVLSTMLSSGVELLAALALAANVVDNTYFNEQLKGAESRLLRGEGVAKALAASDFFPPLVIGMISVGEESGTLDNMLAKAAEIYETDVNFLADRLGVLLEPALIIFLSLLVGGVVLSVFVPLFNIFDIYI
jgi:type IV pilus assembly protein PilC